MRVSGHKMHLLKEYRKIVMECTKEHLLMGKDKVMANLSGKMANNIQASGKMVEKMEVECGKLVMEILIWVNGKMVKFQVMEYIICIRVSNIKENFQNSSNMVMANKNFLMEIIMKGTI